METDPCSDDLHLVLDTSTDASDNKDATGSESEGPCFNSPKPDAIKPAGIQVKSADGKPKKIQITTLSTLSSPCAAKSSSQPQPPKVSSISGIQVKSADGKPKKVQITTLATYTSPKSKSQAKTNCTPALNEEQLKGGDCNALKAVENTLSEKKTNEYKDESLKSDESAKLVELLGSTANEKGDNAISGPKGESGTMAVCSPSGAKGTNEGKPTPKRVQLTTIQLFNSSNKEDK